MSALIGGNSVDTVDRFIGIQAGRKGIDASETEEKREKDEAGDQRAPKEA